MDRGFLAAETVFNGKTFVVGTTHLESLDNKKRRKEQMEAIQTKILPGTDAIFMGDLNFDLSWPDEGGNLDSKMFSDLWTALKDDEEEAFTMNGTSRFKPVVLDHVLLANTSQFSPKFIQRVGNYC